MHEDALERGAGNEIADYGGFALNEAGRLWALSYDPSRVTLRHHQCEGYVAPYQMRSTGNFRIWEERDPRTQRLIAIHVYGQTTEGLRTIWMDGRPHPPAWAPHTARGFSTGRFVGNALVVQTTHIKQGWVRRNGLPGSDQTTMTDFFLRNGDRLTNVTVANDPVFFSEPQVRSNDFVRQPVDHGAWLYACDDGEQILDRAPDFVPHYLFGKQPFAREFAKKYNLPVAASLMGAASMYPESAQQLRTVNADALFSPAPGRPSTGARGSCSGAAAPASERLAMMKMIADLTVGDFGGYQAVLAVHTGRFDRGGEDADPRVRHDTRPRPGPLAGRSRRPTRLVASPPVSSRNRPRGPEPPVAPDRVRRSAATSEAAPRGRSPRAAWCSRSSSRSRSSRSRATTTRPRHPPLRPSGVTTTTAGPTTSGATTTSTAPAGSAAGKPCVAVADALPPGAPQVPVKTGPPPDQHS